MLRTANRRHRSRSYPILEPLPHLLPDRHPLLWRDFLWNRLKNPPRSARDFRTIALGEGGGWGMNVYANSLKLKI